jgi:hypothetical protein
MKAIVLNGYCPGGICQTIAILGICHESNCFLGQVYKKAYDF